MAKLYFRHGTVGSAKTLNLLAVAHNYQQQGKNVLILKPKLDVRFGAQTVKSRAGLEKEADMLLEANTTIPTDKLKDKDCILVDEAQFLSEQIIDQLRHIATYHRVPVICYGLRSDFKTKLFSGSRRLMEIADSIEEVKTTCAFCNKKAIFNLKFKDGQPTRVGPSVDLGAEEKYQPVCAPCYEKKLGDCFRGGAAE
ncbi:MAG: thymidine kinase [Acidobacteria bacterium]|nr:MAG: thymidine kinase [Acidobacteriota bacterium]PIE90805.1 MAG: thymidine kinase [Acidobacteriota bacterium]